MDDKRDDLKSVKIFLVSRFGTIDEQLEALVKALTELPTSEFSSLLLSLSTLSREQLLTRFG
ncbi:hypothetical protein AB0756_12905 [Tolypothrix campylonemoides VB511288_2]|uniref:Uncharacterized protein n=3 Tax=Nostocales TaxID=1161 RepID=A0A8S9T0D6_9CYAN|nr:hypothetical protein DA73_0400008650 [Tolypothrix bouteillei VB521301]